MSQRPDPGDITAAAHALRRREVLVAAGGAGLGLLWTSSRGWIAVASAATEPAASLAGACTLSRELTEGPYWIDNELTRRNITAGRSGAPLALAFTVRDAATCKVIAGADVELWHADAGGLYSGFSQGVTARRFLRGHQRTNASGLARFTTIWPGWYPGRTPHIHLKVHVGGSEVHTGQVFFPDATSTKVYRGSRYGSRGRADTSNADDSIYSRGSLLKVRSLGSGRFAGSITLVVDAG